jgi:hypothetical protein
LKRLSDLRLAHSPRTQGARLPIAEAQQVVVPARRNDRSECGNELGGSSSSKT